jgi:hypothetical protein
MATQKETLYTIWVLVVKQPGISVSNLNSPKTTVTERKFKPVWAFTNERNLS